MPILNTLWLAVSIVSIVQCLLNVQIPNLLFPAYTDEHITSTQVLKLLCFPMVFFRSVFIVGPFLMVSCLECFLLYLFSVEYDHVQMHTYN